MNRSINLIFLFQILLSYISFFLLNTAFTIPAPKLTITDSSIKINAMENATWNLPCSFAYTYNALGLIIAFIPCIILVCFSVDITLYSLYMYGSIGISVILLTFNIVLVISVIWFYISYRIIVNVYHRRDISW